VNSFDQEGVQLGKLLAKKVLAMATDAKIAASDPALAAYALMLGLEAAK
jgi:glucose-6-phosphate isomerase